MGGITILDYETALWSVFLTGCLVLYLVYDIVSLIKKRVILHRIQRYNENLQAFFINFLSNA